MRLVGRGARALATATLRLLPARAALTLEVLACGRRSRWHRGRLTGAMIKALAAARDAFYLAHRRCDPKSEPRTIASGMTCPCGAVFERWVTAEEVELYLLRLAHQP